MGTATLAPPTCEQTILRQGVNRPCGQVVGLRSWYDSAGTLHRACVSHIAGRLHRYPESDPPEPEWLAPDPIDVFKAYTDAGWTEPELRESFGG
jgi:hypothetical protein